MSLAVVSTASPSRHRRHPDICAVVKDLRRRNPRAAPDHLAGLLLDILLDDRDLLRVASRFLIEKAASMPAPRARARRATVTPRQRTERQAVERAEVTRLVEKVREVAVLDMPIVLATGETRKLRFCTGRELAETGAAYSRVAAELQPDEMAGERFCENEIRRILCATEPFGPGA